jgi:predicted KAP-like P-loop ATPase
MPLDETIIAKLAMFERCTDERAFAHLCSLINDSRAGQPEVIAKLEALQEKPDDLDKACPEPWKEHQAFLKAWLPLQPPLAGVDLRAAVYLSREIAPLRVSRSGLSAAAMDCFKTLMVAKTKASPAAKQAIAAVDPTEQQSVMEALINEMRRTTDWQSIPAGMAGATCLGDASQNLSKQLGEFLAAIPADPKPPWLKAMIKSKTGKA